MDIVKAQASYIKYFNGKQYFLDDLFPNKHLARTRAKHLREDLDYKYARVENTPDGWAVYASMHGGNN